ncbi:S4 domain-containing protein [Enterobacteriaceae endosymbiont of Plateumaris rustica]|uniref:S4 domain-containing protein n=1 Tax=Enterobacteriaceae endosymbiont of Plateumaris rustica TaxID=2675796 RepID=UPI001FE6EB01|nr:S4 domain-containing protein [Enterobacteriaceae endosymbiont of Plateumaris rustica]
MIKIIKLNKTVYKFDNGIRLDIFLTKEFFQFSRSQIKNWIINNNIKINNIIINKPKKKLLQEIKYRLMSKYYKKEYYGKHKKFH